MTLCKDCRWFQPSQRGPLWAKCLHPAATYQSINYVDGSTREEPHLCDTMRGRWHPCGPEAELFVPKGGGGVGFV